MTDSNKKPASATPGKPAGRTSDETTTASSAAPEGAPGTPRSGPKGKKVSAAVQAAQAAKAAKSGVSAARKGRAKKRAAPNAKAGRQGVATPGAKGSQPGQAGVAAPKRRDAAAPGIEDAVETLTSAKRALAWTHTARFLTTASQLHHLPQNGVLPGQEPEPDEDFDDQDHDASGGFDDAGLSADHDRDDQEDQMDEGDEDGEPSRDPNAVPETLPARPLPEIAFVGRSNAGKSTAINTLAQQKRLAFASKTPGRTQHINLFVLGPKDAPDALFADLPGYGYAAVARDAKLRWQRVMADYLSQRETLSGVVLMVDSRHGLTDLDKQLLEFVSDRVTAGEVSLLVLLTKADKLNRKDGAAALEQVQKELAVLATEDSDIAVSLFSALSKQGLDDAAELIYDWAHREPRVLRDYDDDEMGVPEATDADPADGADDAHDADPADDTDDTRKP
ncbi:ribosome biogenesis GTP-binding protein YsxC/EngB [Roseateles terrae]|uniref:Probable GTP-binding protein EngB n=2 Tax=Roseateles terrae TaxID=431060 RepID=A0ABR6GTF1_9BURK|nr:ribosome biogenesis GTP-binding protein YsxC/EngB [Roseateles terrae]